MRRGSSANRYSRRNLKRRMSRSPVGPRMKASSDSWWYRFRSVLCVLLIAGLKQRAALLHPRFAASYIQHTYLPTSRPRRARAPPSPRGGNTRTYVFYYPTQKSLPAVNNRGDIHRSQIIIIDPQYPCSPRRILHALLSWPSFAG